MSVGQTFVNSFYGDLHENPTDSLVSVGLGGWKDVCALMAFIVAD
jgi:hypothetical protein